MPPPVPYVTLEEAERALEIVLQTRLVQIAAREETLRLAETFTIANSSVDVEHVCVLTIEHDGVTAFGEGAPVEYWDESAGGISAALEADGLALLGDDLWAIERIAARLRAWDGPQGAKMALDGAVPFKGLGLVDARLVLSAAPGLGVAPA